MARSTTKKSSNEEPTVEIETKPKAKINYPHDKMSPWIPRLVDAFLAPVSIDERKDPLGPHPSRDGKRSSDKGFLAMAEAEYLEVLDWLSRDKLAGKRFATPHSAPPVLERLGIEPMLWSAMVKDFGRAFINVAGTAKSVSEARSRKTHRKFYRSRV